MGTHTILCELETKLLLIPDMYKVVTKSEQKSS